MSCPEYVEAVNVLMGELMRALMTANSPLLGLIQHTSVDHLPDGDADREAAIGVMHPVATRKRRAGDHGSDKG